MAKRLIRLSVCSLDLPIHPHHVVSFFHLEQLTTQKQNIDLHNDIVKEMTPLSHKAVTTEDLLGN